MDVSLPIQIHLFTVIPALILGLVSFILTKGTPKHKAIGKIWVVLMLSASFSSFFITPTGSHTWLHVFAIVVIVSVAVGVFAISNKNNRLHSRCMIGAYIGTAISAVFAVGVSGRLLNSVLL
jgi:uncharacterized membrane protein